MSALRLPVMMPAAWVAGAQGARRLGPGPVWPRHRCLRGAVLPIGASPAEQLSKLPYFVAHPMEPLGQG